MDTKAPEPPEGDGVSGRPHGTADAIAEDVRGDIGTISKQAVYDSLGMLAALTLDELLRDSNVPVIVRLSEEAGFAAALTTDSHGGKPVDNIRAVGLLELSCNVVVVA